MKRNVSLLGIVSLLLSVASARADLILWVDDTAGKIGQVDITTKKVVPGSVHDTGQSLLSDIAFNASGMLYGTTFTGLYSINTATGIATLIGSYGSVSGMNALVGNGSRLLGAASGINTVYSINPASPGSPTTFATSLAQSAGDLAFAGSTLYESAVNGGGNDELVNVSTDSLVGLFHVGATQINSVYGLADTGTTMYAVAGTEVYTVNTSNAALTPLFDYSGAGLGPANGTAFVPEPASLALMGSGLSGLWLLRRRKGK